MEVTTPTLDGLEIPLVLLENFFVTLGLAGLIGVLYCFLGYKLIKVVLGVTGFLVFAGLAGFAVQALFPGNNIGLMIAWLVGGVLGAWLTAFLFKTAVFFLGALGGWVVAYQVLQDRPEAWMPLAVLGIGLVVAIGALILERPILILATAAIGAWMLTSVGLLMYLGPDFEAKLAEEGALDETQHWILLGSWVLLTVLGIARQWRITRKRLPGVPYPPQVRG